MRREQVMHVMVRVLALVALLATVPVGWAGAQSLPRPLALLEQDIAAAMAHAAVLRERLAAETPVSATTQALGNAADLAGIADGGSRSALAALQLVARALDRRIEALGAELTEAPAEHRQLMLHMRATLGGMLWTLHDLPVAADVDMGNARAGLALIERLDRSLGDLDDATTALASFAW
jgi:hypothetical protein